MEWKLSEEQGAYREALRGWLGDTAPLDRVRGWIEAADRGAAGAAAFAERFVGDGMSGVGVPEELGGQGGGVVELALTAEELGRAAAPGSSWLATMLALRALEGSADLVKAALDGGAAMLLPAESLPSTPSVLTSNGRGAVSGTVSRVLGAAQARLLVATVADPEGRSSLRLVEAGAAGVAVRPRRLLDRTRSVADVVLDGAPSTPLDGEPDVVLGRAADLAGVLVAADALGALQRMLDLAVEYSGQRHQFGVPIGSFQAVKHAAAAMLVDVEAGRSGVYYAAASVGGGHPECALHAAAVKAQVTASASRAADTSLTMHGAIGYTWEHDLHLFYKRARLNEQLFGSPVAWNELLAERLRLT